MKDIAIPVELAEKLLRYLQDQRWVFEKLAGDPENAPERVVTKLLPELETAMGRPHSTFAECRPLWY